MEDDTSVRVAVRIRPQISRELIDMCRLCTSVTPGEPQVVLGNDKAFTFDYVFDMNSIQMLIYETCVQQLVEGCFEGYNATVLAYGQTGSGKTYTMGTGFDVNVTDDELGIIPRAVEHLFEGIEERRQRAYVNDEPLPEFKIHVQFMELYNEEIVDLFDTAREAGGKGSRSSIRIHEEANGGIYAVGVTTRVVTSKQETLQCLKVGALSRTTASTNMNVSSSRSHAIFTLHIKQQRLARPKDPDIEMDTMSEFETVTAKFHFVDLAGSERLKRTGATGDRAKEGISINCGLLALGNVISALGDVMKRGSHIPYRDSKLTRLLQDSLGGNSRTLMIACVSPSDSDFMETLNTLRYANRTRNIKNRVIRNQDKTSKTIASLRQEIQQLQLELLEYKQGKRVLIDGEESVNDMYHENTMLQTENNNLRVRIRALQETSEGLTAKNTHLLAEKAAGEWISSGGDASDISGIIQGYLKEVEELRTKLLEAEYTCQTLRRNASRTQIKLSMSPLHSHAVAVSGIYDIGCDAETGSVDEILTEAKKDLDKLRRKEKAKRSVEHGNKDGDGKCFSNEDGMMEDENVEEVIDAGNGEGDEESDSSGSESDTDENEQYRSDLAELSCEISIKQKLIDELELSQKRLQTLRHHYEEKLIQLTNKMRETQEERDRVLANMGNIENVSGEKVRKVREDYERKLNEMMNEVKKIQAAKKEHARLIKNQGQYEKQVKTLRSELDDMKKAKVRLMNKIKEDAGRHKETEQRHNREIARLRKESRKRENQIRTLEAEKKLKEVVLRRKQEEVSALRKLSKPMSDRVAGRVPLGSSRQQELIAQQRRQNSSRQLNSSPKVAKSKWQRVEKDITKLVLNKSAITRLEADMERHLRNREALTRNVERCIKKHEAAMRERKGPGILRDIEDEIETLSANIDYLQENIHECQASIMHIEESKDGPDVLDVHGMVSGMGIEEIEYLIGKLMNMTISQSLLATQNETGQKEGAAQIEKLQQENQMQKQLIDHLLMNNEMSDYFLGLTNGSGPSSSRGDSVSSSRSASPMDGISTSIDSNNTFVMSSSTDSTKRHKARRLTAANPEELLFATGLGCDLPLDRETPEETAPYTDDPSTTMMPKRSTSMSRLAAPNPYIQRPAATTRATLQVPSSSSTRKAIATSSTASTTHSTTTSYTNNVQLLPAVPTADPTRTSPVLSRKMGREGNVFSRLTSGATSGEESRHNSGVIRPYDAKPLPKSTSPLPAPLACIHVSEGHSRSVLDVVATEDLMFSASTDRTVKVWDLRRGHETASLGEHVNGVVVVRYCPQTRQVFSASSAYVNIWDLRESNTRCIKTLHSSGQTTDGTVSVSTPSRPLRMPSGENQINDVRTPDGMSLFTAAGSLVRMWDLRNYCSIGKLSGSHQAAVTCLAVEDVDRRGESTCVVTGSKDHYVKLFEIAVPPSSGAHQAKVDLEPPHYDGIQALALCGSVLFSGSRDMCIKKWDLKRFKLKQSLNQAHKDWVCGLCFACDRHRHLLSCCRGGYVRQWSVDTCRLVGEVKAHGSSINAIVANSSCVFTASNDTTIRIWRPRDVDDVCTDDPELG